MNEYAKVLPVLILLCLVAACFQTITAGDKPENVMNTHVLPLNQNWFFSEQGEENWKPASVPGNIHMDLYENGLIEDPFFGINEQEMQWVGRKDWTWKTRFSISESQISAQNIFLRFNGLDTYATVYLNGEQILAANNMFRTWETDVKGMLHAGENDLEVHIRNVFDENNPKWESAPFRLMAFPNNDQADTMIAMYSRKAQFHYGWDWGPRLVTSGIWRPVELVSWNDFRIEDLHVIPGDVSENRATITTRLEIESAVTGIARAVISLNGAEMVSEDVDLTPGHQVREFAFQVDNPRLWWTNGLGEPYLYDYKVTLTGQNGMGDERFLKTGIRTVELTRNEDEDGREFQVVLNGIPVFMKGANYIPQDNFQNRVTRSHYEYILGSAAEANMNMLRVWGGGIYEENDFYEVADELGLLVWQDFMFACAMYPGDEAYLENVFCEVVDNVKRIRNHPSVALYCGNNENEIAWYQWGWKQMYSDEIQEKFEKDMHNLFYDTIPRALAEADPTRQYTPTSPVAGFAGQPNETGDLHYWGVWHGQEPFSTYNDVKGRFMSEYGFQSYPELSTIVTFTDPEDRHLHSEVMLSHQRCMADDRRDREYGNRLIQTYMDRHYRQPRDFESYLYVSQVLQAEGVKEAIMAHRRNMPFTMGTLYWQINDCWPVASWSSIDYYGNWKALHYFSRDLFRNILVAPRLVDGIVQLHVVSDELQPVEAQMKIGVWNINSGRSHRMEFDVVIPPNTATLVREIPLDELSRDIDPADLALEFSFTDESIPASRQILYAAEPKDLNMRLPEVKVSISETGGKTVITLTTDVLAKNILLGAGHEAARFSDNYFDLLPGESRTVTVESGVVTGENLVIRSLADTWQ
jgi:beta-mannosidase